MNENFCVLISISLKLVPQGPINNIIQYVSIRLGNGLALTRWWAITCINDGSIHKCDIWPHWVNLMRWIFKILYYTFILKYYSLLRVLLKKDMNTPISNYQYHGWWCPGIGRHQDIASNDIDPVSWNNRSPQYKAWRACEWHKTQPNLDGSGICQEQWNFYDALHMHIPAIEQPQAT